uniref:Uncharacterized protein n=1 Tax=Globodera rostochiensis TaxID=31243 RepID=A0A914I4T6_GLORO
MFVTKKDCCCCTHIKLKACGLFRGLSFSTTEPMLGSGGDFSCTHLARLQHFIEPFDEHQHPGLHLRVVNGEVFADGNVACSELSSIASGVHPSLLLLQFLPLLRLLFLPPFHPLHLQCPTMPKITWWHNGNGFRKLLLTLEGTTKCQCLWRRRPATRKAQIQTVTVANITICLAQSIRKAVDDGCEVFMNPSKRLDIEIGTQNITIGCPKAVNVSAISENIYFCVNGTECQKAKTKWSAGCAVFILPDKANRSNYGTEKAPPIGCNDSLVPTSLHITFLEERAPDLRASYYQKRGRFHCPSDVTCLYEMLFPYNFEVVEGRNAVEMSHLAINLTIALFLVFLNGCKLNLGN